MDIVAKNGNLLLNIAPGPDGEWHEEAYERLQEIGAWMKTNGESIYGTKPVAPYRQGQWAFTGTPKATYVTYLPKEGEALPASMTLSNVFAAKGNTVMLLGYSRPLNVEKAATGLVVLIPEAVRKQLSSQPAWVFRISQGR